MNEISTDTPSYTSFEEMDLKQDLMRGIISYGFEKPSTIQQLAIVPFLKGQDIIAQAQSGMGKTATFSIALLQNIDETQKITQALLLAPTRELASQIKTVMTQIGGHIHGLEIALIVGGDHIQNNIRDLKKNPQIIIATPGRIIHLLEDGYVNTKTIKYLVLDEADQILSNDFSDQFRQIYQKIDSRELFCGLYTATVTDAMLELTSKFMNNPQHIFVPKDELSLQGIQQFYVDVEKDSFKFDILIDLFSSMCIHQMMIYCNSVRSSEILKRKLDHQEIPCECIHGRLHFTQRSQHMRLFRKGEIRVLITTDLLCRGIDVQQVSLVINYDFPTQIESYIHRIGRTGRYGRKGLAINFITHYDIQQLRTIETYYQTKIPPLPSVFPSLQ
jgi:translation initiation factor 4A